MSVMKPLEDRIVDIDAYYEGVSSTSQDLADRAVKATIHEFSRARGLCLRSQSRTVELMKKSTNSGSPYFSKRREVVDATLPVSAWVEGSDAYQQLGVTTWKACAVLGWRGQEGGPNVEDVKQRVIWMFPFGINVCELQVYQPLIEVFQRFNLVPAWNGTSYVDERVTQLFDTKGNDLLVCTDFSRFDQHFGRAMQLGAFHILEALLTDNVDSRNWLENVYPIKYSIPLAYDYGKIRYGNHGMGSGSGGTNADETLAHRVLQYEVAQRNSQRLNLNSMCLGDDGILSYPGISIEAVVDSYSPHGLAMNEDKQSASVEDCVYLRRWHHRDYRPNGMCAGVYSTNRALGRLCETERYLSPEEWNDKMVALRQLSILENVEFHPCREAFADYCMKGDRNRLGVDIPGFLDDLEHIVAEAMDDMPEFLGYTKSLEDFQPSSINDWWIVRYLRKKS
nr:MAG: RNA-dependent RNA polymerase [Crogonang virus 156]